MRWEYYGVAILIVLFIGLIVLLTSNSSQGFSKVYFDNMTVPAYVVPNMSYDVVFFIESHEQRTVGYSYQAYLNNVVLVEGNVSLKPGQVVQIPVKVTINNISYHSTVVWERRTSYNLEGISEIVGGINGNASMIHFNDSVGISRGYLPPVYVGPSNLSFLLNVSRNFTITKTVEYNSSGESSIFEYQMVFINFGKGVYRVVVVERKIVNTPESLTLRVVVESTTGKTYQIFRALPCRGG